MTQPINSRSYKDLISRAIKLHYKQKPFTACEVIIWMKSMYSERSVPLPATVTAHLKRQQNIRATVVYTPGGHRVHTEFMVVN